MQKRPQGGLRAIASVVMGVSRASNAKSYELSAYLHLDSFAFGGNVTQLWLKPGFVQLKSGRIGST
ncbi:hypothetical protein [Leptolyngbya sp. FACHB-16]|uniref:hypothetical protein n=1 Tax=unclassified Leptolyngbya TaxID=2650499 RepID=UPI001681E179|nr:hypothetical protein [Leptolyngbya sp. FACHB-16]MBD1910385.1 hypothetical protein [Leptolyngbya sp. FACHB-8]MBD2155313.1 hypothetical protein [Leptolyngbya sp. FACHB-16]